MLKLNSLSGFGSGVSGATSQGTYGYTSGGQVPPNTDTTERMTFATSISALHTDADLDYFPEGPRAISDTTTYGYIVNGTDDTGPGYATHTDRTVFATSVNTANTDAEIATIAYAGASYSDGSTYGYYSGGYTGAQTNLGSRLTFSTSTGAAHTDADLNAAKYALASVSDGTGTYGYVSGGRTYSPLGRVSWGERMTYSTSVLALHTDVDTSTARDSQCRTSDDVTYGYLSGGGTGASIALTDRITFSTSVLAAHTDSDLSAARNNGHGMGDGLIYGYLVGHGGGTKDECHRQTFATGVWAAFTDGDLSTGRNLPSNLSDGSAT
jgi:hypothetical protein|tara:strand:- start:538 stop:1509 length:972 start_codon:yes stop_codon:yes gene_type:complete